jgi:hypothetical protein
VRREHTISKQHSSSSDETALSIFYKSQYHRCAHALAPLCRGSLCRSWSDAGCYLQASHQRAVTAATRAVLPTSENGRAYYRVALLVICLAATTLTAALQAYLRLGALDTGLLQVTLPTQISLVA